MPDIYAPFTWPTRVYWEDTDAGGVVYHAAYLCFLERARTEWLRAMGLQQQRLREVHDLVFAVRGMRLEFKGPARLDDLLDVRVRLLELRGASLRFAQSVERGGDTLVTAEVRAVSLSAAAFRPRPIPAGLFGEPAEMAAPESEE